MGSKVGESKAVLRAKIGRFRYPRAPAPVLTDIDLTIRRGEFVVITGPAGSGKTTLCFCLTGVIPRTIEGEFEGEVAVEGQDLGWLPLPRVGPLIGMVMQAPENQLFNVLVSEDVAFGPENLGLPPAEIERRLWRYLEFTGTSNLADRFSHLLSGGQSQRVVLSAVLALEAGIYVFDQPAAELDPAGREQIYENIFRLNQKEGKTVVLVEDRLADIASFATRIILLEDGRIVRDEAPRRFFAGDGLAERGVRVPQAIEVYHRLRQAGLPLRRVPLSAKELSDDLRPLLRSATHSQTTAHVPQVSPTAAPPKEQALAITVSDLTYRYPTGVEALRGVRLHVQQGEFVAIVGENGAGKTTLAKHLVGLLKPDGGTVSVLGRPTGPLPVHEISKWVGYLFQDPDYQTFNNSCLEEVAYGLRLRGKQRGEVEELALAALEEVGLGHVWDAHPYTLSRGQRQRLALAAVLAVRPPILVVDEPSTGLDYRETLMVLELLSEYREEGGTVLTITHDLEMALAFATRLIIMAEGKIREDLITGDLHLHLERLDEAHVIFPDVIRLARQLDLPFYSQSLVDVVAILTNAYQGGEG